MKSGKLTGILLLVLMFGGAAFYFSEQEAKKVGDQEGGVVFLTGLMTKINQIAQVVITEKDTVTHLNRRDDRWLVQEQSGYDAEFSKVKKLLLGLADLETIESKTSKPENYGRLGVQAVGEVGEVSSKQIQLLDKAGNLLYTLIVGKDKPSQASESKAVTYVRQLNDKQSWLVDGKIEIPRSQVDWLDKSIIDLNASKIQFVEIQSPDGEKLVVSKKDKADESFTVNNLPEKAELKSDVIANSIAAVLQNLSFEGIEKRGEFKADDKKITHVTFRTFDGLQLMAKLIEKDEKHYLWFDVKAISDSEEAKKESSALNAKFALWIYKISESNANKFKKNLEDLIKTKG